MPAGDEEGDDDAMRRLQAPASAFRSEEAVHGGVLAALLGALYISPRGSWEGTLLLDGRVWAISGLMQKLVSRDSLRGSTDMGGPLFTDHIYT